MDSKKSKSSSSRSRRRSGSSEERSHKSSSKRKNHSSDESNDSDRDDRRHRDRRERKEKQSKTDESGGAAENLSLSIEETNKLRAKLGLKPLSVDDQNKEKQREGDAGKKTYIDKDTNQEFEHLPAKNLTDIREQKEFRQKLEEQREKRRLADKIRRVKTIAEQESDSDSESADVWVQKLKQKEEAAKKAKFLEEMDQQYLAETETAKTKKYTSSNLKGLRIEHDQTKFTEGQEVVLTLKDRNIIKGSGVNLELDEEDDADVLVNVNLLDDERASKNVDNKKKKPEYKPYDEFDEDGNYRPNAILDKYDEELNGEQKKSFRLGAKGVYDASDDKFIQRMEDEHKSRAVKLDMLNELKMASDYMTAQEMEKFKKPKKTRRIMRKNKSLKAEELAPVGEKKAHTKPKMAKSESVEKKIDLDDFKFKAEESSDEGEIRSSGDESDIDLTKLDNAQDIKEIIEQENQLLDDLQMVLDRTRKKVTKSIVYESVEVKGEEMQSNGDMVSFDSLTTVKEEEMSVEKDALTLDTISEFCRGIGSEIKRDEDEVETGYKKAEEKMESDEEFNLSDVEAEVENEKNQQDEDSDVDGANVLDEEPIIDRGIGAALKLAVNKGYLAKEKEKQFAKLAKSSIEAKNYTVEERNYYDIDDKYNRVREKFFGPLVDFEEKRNYKPDIKLDYYDEKGHAMNEKEAFRYLSHKFHGKGPGKKKTEKRLSKFKEKETMSKMSSVDTPLNTVELLIEKQKNLQQPFVVLSAPKGKQEQVTLHKR